MPLLSSWISADSGSRTLSVGAAVTATAVAAGTYYVVWRRFTSSGDWPPDKNTKNVYHSSRKAPAWKRRPGYKDFPKPYPNGWVYICASSSLPRRKVVPIDVCGKHLVLFRADDGKAGVLDAFCSHMGTHLGYGGFVSGLNIVCPYHAWEFDAWGQLQHIPYAPQGGKQDCSRARNSLHHYPVFEKNGMIFTWIHADNAEPWDPLVLQYPQEKNMKFCGRLTGEDFHMHPMEPSHNSADWYHFSTIHSTLSQHWRSKFRLVSIDQTIQPARAKVFGSDDDNGKPIEQSEVLIINEVITGIHLFNKMISLPASLACNFSSTQVRFSGPMILGFFVKVKLLGELLCITPLSPTEPFITHMEFWTFASPWFPTFVAKILTRWIRFTINQDRETWERRKNPMPRNRVRGDYSWSDYDRWLKQFYSDSSISYEEAYDEW